MINEKLNTEGYRKQVYSKFISFSEKSPILLDVSTVSNSNKEGLLVEIKNTTQSFFYEWDYSVEPKVFIHSIKLDLEKYYPELNEIIYEEHEITSSEVMSFMERGYKISEIPKMIKSEIGKRTWVIDKVIVWRDIAILVNKETREQFRYKLSTNLVLFLKKYRTNGFSNSVEAGAYFFERASLLNKIDLGEG